MREPYARDPLFVGHANAMKDEFSADENMGTVGYNGMTGAKAPVFHPLLTNTASMLAGMRRT